MSDSEVEYDIAGSLNPANDSSDDGYSSGEDSDASIQDIISDDEEETTNDKKADMAFPTLELSEDEDEEEDKPKKRDSVESYFGAPVTKKGSSGSFAGLGLSQGILKNIARKGFKQPTPIQRKTIPLVLEGKDVVGMARTGSGKTAAFVLPMLEKLKVHSAKVGARAVILSPSRELAMQTLKVVKDFSAGTDLRLAMLVGGDSLEEQFKMMMSNPDIIIATPGRFLHLKVEMELSLASVEYIVFDEADRLFELGFGEQMNELLASLPSNRQTLLFSATLPKTLVEFAKAGLHDPILVRLDAETKLPEHLEMTFFSVKENQRDACLAFILKEVIKMPFATAEQLKELERMDERAINDGENDEDSSGRKKKPKFKKERLPPAHELPSEKSTIVFCPTKHHVEYVIVLLQQLGYAVSYIYGTLDQHARKNQLYRFRTGKTSILVVTDVAARGIDVPVLANVINYSLPPSPKVFIHRVGRTARAGNRGWAYSIIKDNDIPYLLDLEVFLGRKLLTPQLFKQQYGDGEPDYVNTLTIGAPPRAALEIHGEELSQMVKDSYELQQLSDVAVKGERMYNRTKGSASQESAKRAKQIMTLGWDDHHLMFGEDGESAKDALLARLGQKRIRETVFEFRKSKTTSGAEMMATRRAQLAPIQRRAEERKAIQEKERLAGLVHTQDAEIARNQDQEMATEADLDGFTTEEQLRKSKKRSFRDSENFMSHYAPTNDDKGYAIGNFAGAASNATFDLINDGSEFQQKQGMRWDKKKGKFINAGSEGNKKYIRGEGGQRIAASFRSGRFDKWKAAHKVGNLKVGSLEESGPGSSTSRVLSAREFKHNKNEAPKRADKYRDDFHKQKTKVAAAKEDGRIQKPQPKSELKSTADVRKGRILADKRKQKNARPSRGKGGRGGKK
ncbi:ATP-dependent RNA helicase DBP10 [Yarrowia sp. B02]|nr:ATP-dependent RNA helicase DBP10 [Yarrowia sp. B02]